MSASAIASRNLPPFTVISFCPACRIADNTVIGIASFNAHEKSTISIERAFVTFLVTRYVSTVPPSVYGTSESARCSALLSRPDLSFSDSSIILTILSYLLFPPFCLTRIVSPPSSITVPANTDIPSFFATGTDSPVSEAWLTIASPCVTTPSKGIILLTRTIISSSFLIVFTGTNTSVSAVFNQTLLTLSDIVLARSPTDFLCVHSSIISPMPRRNITEPAVLKSFLNIETPMAVASSTGTSILPFASVLTPFAIYLTDLNAVTAFLNGIGRNILLAILKNTLLTSLS